jgi:hypothetical protein
MKRHELKVGEKYRNLKTKNVYTVTGFATHSETKEQLVLYARNHGTFTSGTAVQFPWARPLDLFLQKFERYVPLCANDQCLEPVRGDDLFCSDRCSEMSCVDRGYPPLEVMDEIKNTPLYLRRRANLGHYGEDFVDDDVPTDGVHSHFNTPKGFLPCTRAWPHDGPCALPADPGKFRLADICEHGINHGGERHGCDGCCDPDPWADDFLDDPEF